MEILVYVFLSSEREMREMSAKVLKVPCDTIFHQYIIGLRYMQNMSLKEHNGALGGYAGGSGRGGYLGW